MTTPYSDEKKQVDEDVKSVSIHSADDREPHLIPSDEDLHVLRRVPASIPFVALLICLVEFAERASYYGTTGPFNNFINMPLPAGGNGAGAVAPGDAGKEQSAGALGMGSVAASAIVKMFTFLSYIIPIFGGMVADSKWGRFKTICIGTAVGAFAHILLVVPALPPVIAHAKASLGSFIVSTIILSFAAGFIKPSIGPLVCDQSPVKAPTIKVLKNGDRVIVDPQSTIQRYLLIVYAAINIGSIFQISTQYSARLVGFWLAFVIPGGIYLLVPLASVLSRSLLRAQFSRMCNGGVWKFGRGGEEWWAKAKPSQMLAAGTEDMSQVSWDDQFVEEVRQTLNACVTFTLLPIFNLANGGMGNNMNDMSTAMVLHGIPNDFLGNFNSITIVVATPIVTFGVFPAFRRIGRPLKPMTRLCIGFMMASIGCIFAAVIQSRVYSTSPCGKFASKCEEHSTVSLWWQLAPIGIPAIGELFVNVTAYELAYTRSPPRMKGLVYALALSNSAFAAAISMACSAALTDPYLLIPWIVLACLSFVCAWIFPTFFRHLNEFDFEWSAREKAVVSEGERNKKAADVEALRDEDRY